MILLRTSLIATIVLLLTGCVGGYPGAANINDRVGESESFPKQVAGFVRVNVLLYRRDSMGFSTGYNYIGPDAQVISTFYVFPKRLNQTEFARQFDAEKNAITKFHSGARMLGEEQVELAKHGATFTASKATFEYDEDFGGVRRHLYSELWLWTNKEHYLKLRSTAPFDQQAIAADKTFELLNAVDWAPDRRLSNPSRPQNPAQLSTR